MKVVVELNIRSLRMVLFWNVTGNFLILCGAWRPARTPPVSSVDSRSSSSLFKLLSPPHRRHFGGLVCSSPSSNPSYLRVCFWGYFFFCRSVWSQNRTQTELCFRLLQWADKAEEGIRAWQLRRVGLKRRNSPFSGKFARMSFLDNNTACPIMDSVTLHFVRQWRTRTELCWCVKITTQRKRQLKNNSARPCSYISYFTATFRFTLYNYDCNIRAWHIFPTTKLFFFVNTGANILVCLHNVCIGSQATPQRRNPVVNCRSIL